MHTGQVILTDGVVTYAPSVQTQMNPSKTNPLKEPYILLCEAGKQSITKVVEAPITTGAEYLERISVEKIKSHLYRIGGEVWGINVKYHRFIAPVNQYCVVPGLSMPVFFRQKRNGDRYWIAPVRITRVDSTDELPTKGGRQ